MSHLDRSFDAEVFRRQGHQLVDQLSDYLAQAVQGGKMPVLPWVEPAEMVSRWPADFPAEPRGELGELLERVIAESNHLHHPRYVGHQVTSPMPFGALGEFASTLLNNAMAVYEMGPVGTAIERNLARWLMDRLGFPAGGDGISTSGGSAGNLTALLAARQTQAGFDVWTEGTYGGPPLAFLVSEHAHYSILRALQIMGLGKNAIVPVPVDARYKLKAEALPEVLAKARAGGRRVLGVCAGACSTATGAFDPLEPIAEFCAKERLWLHVDGAHGASASLSPKHRHLLKGIERADSVVWDAHKMILMPALCTAVLFRDGRNSFHAFAQHASYLFAGKPPEEEWYNGAIRTIECTKRMMSFPLYATLYCWGTALFAEYVERTFALGRTLGEKVRARGDFELPVEPECNIVCFRYAPQGLSGSALDELQAKIRTQLIADGSFYLVQTRLRGALYLRVTLINPLTSPSDLDALLEAAREAGRKHA
jgi:L-2,4-diaminobutyrate decarboxylase